MHNLKNLKYLLSLYLLFAPLSYSLAQPKVKKKLKDIKFVSDIDGTHQFYIEILPGDFDPNKKYDLSIGLHGHGADRWQFATSERPECLVFRKFAAKHNMIIISPDYRAKTSWMGPKAEADLMQIIDRTKKRYKINRIYIIGASMGGTSALTFAVLHPDIVDGIVSMNGHANHLEFENFQQAIAESFGGTKDQIPFEYKKRSAEYWPERLTMPIAFTIGQNDRTVPPESIIHLAEVLENMKQQVLLIKSIHGGHATNYYNAMAAMEFVLKQSNTLN